MSFTEIFSYPFAVRAVIVGLLLSLCAALLGVNLVLKRFSMLGDGLSHVSFGAAAIALAAGVAPLKFSIPVVIIAAFLLLRLNESSRIGGDAAIAIVSSGALAVGIAVATMTTGMNTDISNYMFGSILALSRSDVVFTCVCAAVVLTVYVLFYEKIFISAFDESFAAATGVSVKLYNGLTAILTAVTVVVGMRVMGALLISSIMTFPALTSMRVCRKYRTTVTLAAVISVISFASGISFSFFFDMPAGSAVVIMDLLLFILFSVLGKNCTKPKAVNKNF